MLRPGTETEWYVLLESTVREFERPSGVSQQKKTEPITRMIDNGVKYSNLLWLL